jgi:hypothetical protein
MKKWFKDWAPLPPDMVALTFTPIIIIAVTLLTTNLLWLVLRGGVLSVFLTAIATGVLGVALLLFARLPLYRRGQFFSFGPRMLDAPHRKLYWRAYGLVVLSVLLMVALLMALR